jgi:hypothetical protein
LALFQSTLLNSRHRATAGTQFKRSNQLSAFLCHSHKDRAMALGLQVFLKEAGVDLYIDWQDPEMPESPDRQTAERIQTSIQTTDRFLFLATANSTNSRWCPWEIGYADGKKDADRILVIPTRDTSGNHYGNEYLQLYRRIDSNLMSQIQIFRPGAYVGSSMQTI